MERSGWASYQRGDAFSMPVSRYTNPSAGRTASRKPARPRVDQAQQRTLQPRRASRTPAPTPQAIGGRVRLGLHGLEAGMGTA